MPTKYVNFDHGNLLTEFPVYVSVSENFYYFVGC